jgi:PAS domain S-box-containing protein
MDMLIFVEGPQKGQRYPVSGRQMTLGRDHKNDIPLDDVGSSRKHASIHREGASLILRDMASTNGTYVNLKKIDEVKLKHGDRITIGDTVILIERSLSGEVPKVLVSEESHSVEGSITVEMDSTVLLSPQSLAEAKAEAHGQILSLFNFISKITGYLDMSQLLPIALKEMLHVLKADRGAILFLNKADELVPQVITPEDSDDVVISRTITERVLASRQGLLSNPGSSEQDLRKTVAISRRDVGSVLCVPLLTEDRVTGVVYLDTRALSVRFSERSLHLMSAMAMQLAIAVQNANLYKSLRNSEEFASCILKSMGSGLMVVDERGIVIRANDTACQVLELEQKDLTGIYMAGIAQLHEMAGMVEQTRLTGIPMERSEVAAKVNDRDIPLGVSTSLLEDYSGKASGVICTFRDLTRLKKLGEEVRRSQRLASLGEMAAGIAHEIRNPLNSVYGFAQLLQESAAKRNDLGEQEYASIISEEVTRIDKIVQDMLDFSRQQDFAMSELDLTQALKGIIHRMTPDSITENLTLGFSTPEKKPITIMGNADKLVQVFSNIIRNACQACAEGGEVNVSAEVLRDAAHVYPEAVISIVDDGDGISKENLEKIFNPFFTTKDQGTGLGLSICQKIIEQHAGRIEVESEPGLGSTFRVYLPVRAD